MALLPVPEYEVLCPSRLRMYAETVTFPLLLFNETGTFAEAIIYFEAE
jgi:hypothetical protein